MLKKNIVIIGTWFQNHFVKIFIAIYGIELIFALLLSSQTAAKYTYLLAFSDCISTYIPAIHSLDNIAKFPEGMRIFITISYGFMLIKTILGSCFFIKLLIVDHVPSGISPLAKHKNFSTPKVLSFFGSKTRAPIDSEKSYSWFSVTSIVLSFLVLFGQIDFPRKKFDYPEPSNRLNNCDEQRSWLSIIFFSLAIWGLGFGSLWGLRLSFMIDSGKIISGGAIMWLHWSLINIVVSLFITLAIFILIEWIYYFYLVVSRVR